MDHEIAVRTQAVDRYLMGELRAAEREAFEEHFFVCAHCSRELRDGAMFIENARALFQQESRDHSFPLPAARTGPRIWASYGLRAAMLALLALAGYQNLYLFPRYAGELAAYRDPSSMPEFPLAGAVRGTARTVELPKQASFYWLRFDVPPSSSGYQWFLEDSLGRKVVPPTRLTPLDGAARVLVPAHSTPDGEYVLVVTGSAPAAAEIGRYRWKIQRKGT